ncbi:hypothetical protein BA895_09460 [Humibacillus sp. DSM 29435]|uniref:ABC transporter permease n=1 Tax=Humibacillus sp. DSM 29435 TaxID=1869167 RepID=UPI0008724880|nr:ABC transporter permease [Humibacillus sp. DSM 29435]OFE14576.1 hypothetical protein BA895_09460 [Humibacillus sp. DSM 29435]
MILLPQVRGVVRHRQVLDTLVRRDLRVRYARSAIGYLWTIIDPLAMALIYFVVFSYIFKRGSVGYQPYVLFITIGVLAWQWFSSSVNETSRSLLAEARLVRSTNLPRPLWVVRVVIAKGIEFVLSLPVLAAFALVFILRGETTIHYRIVLVPVAIIMQALLLVGLGLLLAPITVIFSDMPRIVRILLRMGFYATPIIYGAHAAPPVLQKVLLLNPMAGILEMYRGGFFPQELNIPSIVSAGIITVITLISGTIVFKRLEPAVLKEI